MTQIRKVTIKQGKLSAGFGVRELEDWQIVANKMAKMIEPGAIIALSGPLGAGKTTLVQFIAKALGAPKRAISPTFALMRIYHVEHRISNVESRGRKSEIRNSVKRIFDIRRLVHVDAYRLEDEKDLIVLDLDEELTEPGTVLLIEWPENVKKWLKAKKTIDVSIKMEN